MINIFIGSLGSVIETDESMSREEVSRISDRHKRSWRKERARFSFFPCQDELPSHKEKADYRQTRPRVMKNITVTIRQFEESSQVDKSPFPCALLGPPSIYTFVCLRIIYTFCSLSRTSKLIPIFHTLPSPMACRYVHLVWSMAFVKQSHPLLAVISFTQRQTGSRRHQDACPCP